VMNALVMRRNSPLRAKRSRKPRRFPLDDADL
jgi:hypothetical protein